MWLSRRCSLVQCGCRTLSENQPAQAEQSHIQSGHEATLILVHTLWIDPHMISMLEHTLVLAIILLGAVCATPTPPRSHHFKLKHAISHNQALSNGHMGGYGSSRTSAVHTDIKRQYSTSTGYVESCCKVCD